MGKSKKKERGKNTTSEWETVTKYGLGKERRKESRGNDGLLKQQQPTERTNERMPPHFYAEQSKNLYEDFPSWMQINEYFSSFDREKRFSIEYSCAKRGKKKKSIKIHYVTWLFSFFPARSHSFLHAGEINSMIVSKEEKEENYIFLSVSPENRNDGDENLDWR